MPASSAKFLKLQSPAPAFIDWTNVYFYASKHIGRGIWNTREKLFKVNVRTVADIF